MRRFHACCVVLLGCGCDCSQGVSLAGLKSMVVAPTNQVLQVNGSTPATQSYTATGTYQDGHTADITSATAFAVADTTLGSFSGNTFTSTTTHGGITQVKGVAGAISGQTGLTVELVQIFIDGPDGGTDGGTIPSNPGQLFTGPPGGTAPQIVYPSDGVLFPPNLGSLEVHFRPGAGNTLFELSFVGGTIGAKVYLRCSNPFNGGCIYTMNSGVWFAVAQGARGGSPVAVTLKGTNDTGTFVATSTPISISFSQDAISGGLYYWTTSNGTAIMRFDFAGTQTSAARFVSTQLTGGTCVGCHALSRDGTRLVAEAGGQSSGKLLLLDVATQTPITPYPASGKSIFETWNPDGGSFVGVYGDQGATDFNLLRFNGTDATAASPVDIPGTGTSQHPADHPDWASDGRELAYVKVGQAGTDQRMWGGAVELIATNDGVTWGSPTELVSSAAGKNRYYPAIAPDNSFLLFDESTCQNPSSPDFTCNADTDATATLFAVSMQSGSTPVKLAHANAPGITDNGNTELTNTFPKWSPFVFARTSEVGSRLMWVTFSSSRNYGLRPPPAGQSGGEHPDAGTLIWMSAVDPDRLATGTDPSYSAFCLPFQDVATSNHIAQWTTQVVGVIQ